MVLLKKEKKKIQINFTQTKEVHFMAIRRARGHKNDFMAICSGKKKKKKRRIYGNMLSS